ncbi:MAG: DUF456 family protein [Planctomycetota bacterium]|nr:DUF456 family protein [Planctomycetota bacterium]
MIYLWATLLNAVNLACVALVVFQLPGTWVMLAVTAGAAWWQWGQHLISPWVLVTAAVLAVAGEVLEFFGAAVGVKTAGGAKAGMLGGLVGALVGALAATFLIPIPIVGTLIGVCVGAGVGAGLLETLMGRQAPHAVKIAVGAGAGRLAGTLVKLFIAVAMWMLIAINSYWRW